MSEKALLRFDRVILAILCFLFFVLPFAKAAVVTFSWMAVGTWIIKRAFFVRPVYRGFTEFIHHRLLLCFLLVNAVSVLTSVDAASSLEAFFSKLLRYTMIYFITYEIFRRRRNLKIFSWAVFATAFMLILDAVFQYFRGRDFLRGYPYIELTASFSSGNAFAGWLLIMFFAFTSIYFYFKRQGNRLLAWILIIAAAVFLVFLFLTRSGGGLLGLIVAGLIFFHWTIRKLSNKTKFLILLFIAVSMVCLKMTAVTEGTVLERMHLWKESVEIIEDFPVLGIGPNTYAEVAKSYKLFPEGGIYPHNSFLHMTAELGLVGVSVFLSFIFSFYSFIASALRKQDSPLLAGLLAGLSGFLIHSFFDTHLYSMQMATLFWFVAGIATAVAAGETGVG